MSKYLGAHPNIFISNPKEPNYFCFDFPELQNYKSVDEYLEIFSQATSTNTAIGEASTWYLHSKVAVTEIKKFNPDARFIAMVRNPVELVQSLHSQYLFNGYESEPDFGKAWSRPLSKCANPLYHYPTVGKLSGHLERFIDSTSANTRLILLYDDLAQTPLECFQAALALLCVSYDGRTDFEKVNQNKKLRSALVAKFARDTPYALKVLATSLKRLLGIEEIGLMERLLRANTVTTRRKAVDPGLAKEIEKEFHNDIRRIEKILERRCDHWVKH